MDDDRIRQITEEVLAALRGQPATPPASSLEARVTVLEAAARGGGTMVAAAVVVSQAPTHPSLRVLGVAGGGEGRCLLEPDRPCERSGTCRLLGH